MGEIRPLPLPVDQELSTCHAAYSVRATLLGEDVLGSGARILVMLDRRTPAQPVPEKLRERFGLTRRQACVALLLAEGGPTK